MDENEMDIIAAIAAHERLIRDLVVMVLGKLPNPDDALKAYAGMITNKDAYIGPIESLHSVENDHLNQLISEKLRATLESIESVLGSPHFQPDPPVGQ